MRISRERYALRQEMVKTDLVSAAQLGKQRSDQEGRSGSAETHEDETIHED
jgi:hypothetical protein